MKGRLIHTVPEWRKSPNPATSSSRRIRKEITPDRPDGADIPESYSYRLFMFFLACFQNSLMGGLVYGWPALTKMLTEPREIHGGCGLLISQTTVLFSLASITGMISTLVLGYVLDRAGPRVCSVTSHVSLVVGCVGFGRSETMLAYGISMCCIGFGGPGIGLSIVHLANLFPKNQFTALSLLNGSMSISVSVFALFGILWDTYEGISYRHLFESFAAVIALSMIGSFCIWPDYSFKAAPVARHTKPTVEDEYIEATTAHQRWMTEQSFDSYLRKEQPGLARHNSFLVSKKAMESGMTENVSLKDAPFWTQLYSGYYNRGNIFFLVLCFWANFCVASITMELADINIFPVAEQYRLLQVFAYIMGAGVLASFGVGSIMDHSGVEIATMWTIGLAMCHQLILINVEESSWMMIGFGFYVFYRQCLFPVSIALITSRLGFKYFGLLNGICFVLSGLTQMLMVPIVNVVAGTCHKYDSSDPELIMDTCDHGKWKQLHVIELASMALLFLVPVYDFRAKVFEKKQFKKLALLRSSWRVLYGGSYESTASMSPLLGRSTNSIGSYGSNSPGLSRIASIRERREDAVGETDDEVLEF